MKNFFSRDGMNSHQSTNPYARPNGAGSSGAGTYVPGMHDNTTSVDSGVPVKNETPVVGFLYSISRKGIGEYWPLHLGTNTIGRAADCDICLQEMSVSEYHAVISIKQMKTTRKLIASIRDTGSKNGMFLNDEELDYDNHTCKNHDLITVGTCYKLLLLLVNAEEYGLSVAEDFVSSAEVEGSSFQSGMGTGGDFSDDVTHNPFGPSHDGQQIDTGTVDLNGAEFQKPGGTKFM